jgi:hypothetical protein
LTASSAAIIIDSDIIFERKIKLATEGLFERYFKLLSKLQPKQNAIAIADFIISLNTEINPSTNHKMAIIEALQMLSKRHHIDKSFKDMVRDDIIFFPFGGWLENQLTSVIFWILLLCRYVISIA